MITLKELQDLGCLPKELVVCKKYQATTVSDYGNCSDEEKKKAHAVVLDKSIWVATPNREPPLRANVVYSYDGKVFGLWTRQNQSFCTMEFTGNSLVTNNIIFHKEDMDMSELNLNGMDFEQAVDAAASQEPKKMDIGSVAGAASAKSEAEKKKSKQEAEARRIQKENIIQKEVSEIRSIASRTQSGFKVDPKFIDNNRRKGRFLGFFVGADEVVKVSLKQTPINSGNAGAPHYSLRNGVTLPPELEKKFAGGTKNIGSKYLESKTDIVFKQAAPSNIVAGIVKTPQMSELTHKEELDGSKEWTADKANDNSFIVRVLPKEALFAYLELNYDKKIMEDESIPNHTTLAVKMNKVVSKNAQVGTSAAKVAYRTRIVAEGRQTFVAGNYFPLETYDTVLLGAASAEEKRLANNNFSALMKQFSAAPRTNRDGSPQPKKGDFSEEAQQLFNVVDSESDPNKDLYVCTSSIVDKGASIACKPFGSRAKDEMTIDITELPVREAKDTKEGASTRYTYRKSKFNEGNNPAINDTKYAGFIQRVTEATGDADFVALASKAKKTSKTSSKPTAAKSASDRISGLEMLALRGSSEVKVDQASSIQDIFEAFNNAVV